MDCFQSTLAAAEQHTLRAHYVLAHAEYQTMQIILSYEDIIYSDPASANAPASLWESIQ